MQRRLPSVAIPELFLGLLALAVAAVLISAESPEWISTELVEAKIDALEAATQDAQQRAKTLVEGLGGKLGRMRSSSLGVYQVTPRFSTAVTDYGVNDVSTREKDVNAVVSATFDVKD